MCIRDRDLLARWQQLEGQLIVSSGMSSAIGKEQRSALHDEVAMVEREIAISDSILATSFPQYKDLSLIHI